MSMASHDVTFKNQLRTLYHDRTVNEDEFVERLANIITEHMASALVTIQAGQLIAVLPPVPVEAYGTMLAAPSGPVTGGVSTPNEGYELVGDLS